MGAPFTEREIFKQPLNEQEIRELLGDRSAAELFSTKSPRFKALGLEGVTLTDDARIRLMAQEPYLIRRPTFKLSNGLVIGLDTKRLESLLS